jgi:hypothetical protein
LRFAASLPEARRARVAAHFWRALAQQIHPFGGLVKFKAVVCLLAFASLFSVAASAQDVQKLTALNALAQRFLEGTKETLIYCCCVV